MEGWAISFIAGWYCGTTGSRLPEWLLKLLKRWPPPPPPEDGPIIHPWGVLSPIIYGALGGAGGVGALAIAGAAYAGQGSLWAPVVLGFLGGGVGLSVAETLAGMSGGGPKAR